MHDCLFNELSELSKRMRSSKVSAEIYKVNEL